MLPKGSVTCKEPMLEQIFLTNTAMCGALTLGQTEGLQPMGRINTGAGEQCGEEGEEERSC